MLGKLFKKKEEIVQISMYAPVTGDLVVLEDVPDPVFSQKMMGDGIAIKPVEETVTSPVDGEVIQLFPTKHAIGIRAKNGAEILIHIGLDTVNLEGEGFSAFVQEGDSVKASDMLITFDSKVIAEKATSTLIPVIITNTDAMSEIIPFGKKESVTAGEDVILSVKKN
ncbi:PTS sugar transporter subunit IIA [Virgibacillus siamensis]|uniref:PTS sugar transporter subunit IIA n=1 Tax=Virgibacillus siamensis TaxID=480071 RepID=UPI00098593D0|nr:PTS glucose transporter subunit IIA [Virgibacillus siamensis]